MSRINDAEIRLEAAIPDIAPDRGGCILGLGDDRDREGLQETPAATGGDIETLSDDEAEALLARELSGLDHGGRDGN